MVDHSNKFHEEVENARILLREGLVEEAKRTLFRVLVQKQHYEPAKELLAQIEAIELAELLRYRRSETPLKETAPTENVSELIEALSRDLQVEFKSNPSSSSSQEKWVTTISKKDADMSARELYDLGIAYFEMDCFADAYRELNRAERKIRIEQTFLGSLGVAVVALIAECLLEIGKIFEAKVYLEPILVEPDLRHEDKIPLYYLMGCIEQELADGGTNQVALGWFSRVSEIDFEFRDVQNKIRQLSRS